MKKIVQTLFLSAVCTLAHHAYAAPRADLLGEWEMCNDPDGDPKDVLLFKADGTGINTSSDGRAYSLTFSNQDANVMITIQVMTRRIQIPLSISADGKTLNKPNMESRTTTTYVRKGNPDKFMCSAK